MKTYFHLNANNEPVGPKTPAELRELERAGTINQNTLVAAEGDSVWKPLREVLPPPGDNWWKLFVESLKTITADPVGGVPLVGGKLDDRGSMRLGLTFGAAFIVAVLTGVYILIPEPMRKDVHMLTAVNLTLVALPFICIAVSNLVARSIFRVTGGFGKDLLIAGTTIQPLGFLVLLAGLVGFANFEVILVLAIFALSVTILILYSGCHNLSKMSERAASIAVPIILIGSGFLLKIICFKMLADEITNGKGGLGSVLKEIIGKM